jgi:hypothetical protein
MSLNPMGVLDLSIVTELLMATIGNYWPDSALWATLYSDAYFKADITGLTPDAVRKRDGCQLTLSLLHIEANKSLRNFVYPLTPQLPNSPSARAQQIPALPLALDLYYFVTAYSDNNYQQEQQAISIVLNCFHQNPILHKNVLFPGSPPQQTREEFSLTMEIESIDSMSRFWQAITVPFRLSLIYRVSVVFLTPPAPPALAKSVIRYGLAVEPAAFPLAPSGQVFGTSSTTVFAAPPNPPAAPESVQIDYSPATVVPGERFFLYGAGLNQGTDYTGPALNPGTSYRVFLSQAPDFSDEQEVTASWKTADTDPNNPIQTAARVVLDLPANIGALPANAPPPGVYSLRVGSQTPADAVINRTSATPFTVAARVDAPSPLIVEAGGQYAITGMGFVGGGTELLLDTTPLNYVTTPLAAGQFSITGNSAITFKSPGNLSAGLHTVRIRVNGVESPPGLWIRT